jgi:AcrR family transcriptional regulator
MTREKNRKRELILDTAFRLFLNKGLQGTKIIDISEAAGIGKGTVYEYFDSKEEIICELFKTRAADPYQDLPHLIDKEKTCEDKIKAYVEFELDHTGEAGVDEHSWMEVFIKTDLLQHSVLTDAMRELTEFKFSVICRIVEEGIKKGEFLPVNPLLATAFIMGTVNFFAGLNFDLLPFACSIEMEQRKSRSKEELYGFLLGGLKNGTKRGFTDTDSSLGA